MLVAALALGAAAVAEADVYTGGLTYTPGPPPDAGDGLYVSGKDWPGYTVTMEWTVTDEDPSPPGFPWKYTYTFGHSGTKAGLSHLIIETSENFTTDDITGVTGQAKVADSGQNIGLQKVSSGNPNMPEDVFGIRFEPTSSGQSVTTWTFFSSRVPVWGDFYAKNGGNPINCAWNFNDDGLGTLLGFLDPDGNDSTLDDPDPLDPACGGSIDYHILRPDTRASGREDPDPAPEPAGLTLIGLVMVAVRKRRS